MELGSLSKIFKYVIVGIIYTIIFVALIIMYKDIKNPKEKNIRKKKKVLGLEVILTGKGSNLKNGSVIPIENELTLGRKNDNLLILNEPFVSSYHAKLYIRNNQYMIKDLDSTNGTLINGKKIKNPVTLKAEDEIKIGNFIFKVIG